jgi:hypothetical protein
MLGHGYSEVGLTHGFKTEAAEAVFAFPQSFLKEMDRNPRICY